MFMKQLGRLTQRLGENIAGSHKTEYNHDFIKEEVKLEKVITDVTRLNDGYQSYVKYLGKNKKSPKKVTKANQKKNFHWNRITKNLDLRHPNLYSLSR